MKISSASSSYCCLCSGVRVSSDSSLIKALEHVPKARFAHAARAGEITQLQDVSHFVLIGQTTRQVYIDIAAPITSCLIIQFDVHTPAPAYPSLFTYTQYLW